MPHAARRRAGFIDSLPAPARLIPRAQGTRARPVAVDGHLMALCQSVKDRRRGDLANTKP